MHVKLVNLLLYKDLTNMRFHQNPQQIDLFDLFESQMSLIAYERLKKSFHAVFRHIILCLMPVPEIVRLSDLFAA